MSSPKKHSEFMRNEYLDETQATYPYFSLLLDTIRDVNKVHFTPSRFFRAYAMKQNIEKGLQEIKGEDALFRLIELSVLGVMKPHPITSPGFRSMYSKSYQYRYLAEPTEPLPAKSGLRVHPSLLRFLNLTEPTSVSPVAPVPKRPANVVAKTEGNKFESICVAASYPRSATQTTRSPANCRAFEGLG